MSDRRLWLEEPCLTCGARSGLRCQTSRYGGKPTTAGDKLEVWPVRVISRTASNMTNNTVATFTVTFSVPEEPAEDAVLAT